MSLLSQKELLNSKLDSILVGQLRTFALQLGISKKGTKSEIIKRVLERQPDEKAIDEFITQEYAEGVRDRRSIISDKDLKQELMKVKTFAWGTVQGRLDQKIQAEYVRRIVRYKDLLGNVKAKLHDDVTNYVVCTWFNHWTTVLIEEHISSHSKIIPTLKHIKGIDLFFDGQPFDLKVTYLPREYDPVDAMKNPSGLAIWMYENQGADRFGDDNRLFIVFLDKNTPERSWKLKRDFAFSFPKIDNFFDMEVVTKEDEIVFSFGKKTYTATTKVLMIIK